MWVFHLKYVFNIFFLLTNIYFVLARSVCPTGQFWELSAETCVSCALICVHSGLQRTTDKCASHCPGYYSAPPASISGKPVQPTGTPSTVQPSVKDIQLVTVLVPIAVVLLVLVVAVIISVRHRLNFRLCGYDKNPDQDPALANNNEPASSSSNTGPGRDVDVEQRQILLDSVPTEESCTPVLESGPQNMPQGNHSAEPQCDVSSCNEEEEPDTAVKDVEGLHPVLLHPLNDLDETTPKSHAVKSEYVPQTFLSGKDVGYATARSFVCHEESDTARSFVHHEESDTARSFVRHEESDTARSFVHHEESDTELKKSIVTQNRPSFRADHFQMSVYHSQTVDNGASWSSIHDLLSSQITQSPGQSALLLPQGQINSVADPMHEKMGVQVQDGAEDIEESHLLAIKNTQPQTVLPNKTSIPLPLSTDGIYSYRRQAVDCETDEALFSDESIYQSFHGECAVLCCMEHEKNADFDSLHPAKINRKAHAQSPDLTNIPIPPNPTECPSLSSSQCYQTVVPSKDLTNIPILSLTSMPSLGPGFVEHTDSDSLVNPTDFVQNRSRLSNLGT